MSIDRRSFLALGGAALIGSSVGAQNRAYALETIPAGKTLKDADGKVVLSYLTSKPEGVPLAGNSVCCIHPFNTPGGEAATDIAPADHRDHRGIFIAWHDMSFTKNGQTVKGDFWGWGQFAPTADRVIKNREVRLVRASAQAATIGVSNDWMIGPDVMLREETTIVAAEDGVLSGPMRIDARVLDLTFRFTSDYDVTLNRMAFTGFCFRCRKEGPYTFFNSEGEVTLPNSSATRPESDWPAKPWYSHTVDLANPAANLPTGRVISSAVIDHPGNPPSLWHGARGVSFLNPCIAADGPVTFASGKPLTLRYGAIALDGKFPDGWLDRMAAAWRTASC